MKANKINKLEQYATMSQVLNALEKSLEVCHNLQEKFWQLQEMVRLDHSNENLFEKDFVEACMEARRLADKYKLKNFNCYGIADGDYPFYKKRIRKD